MKDVSYFKDQELVVLGGGDSAVDWALTLSEVAKKSPLFTEDQTLEHMK